jgi:serine/threonine protein kinase
MKFVEISQKDYEEAVKNAKNNSGSNSTNFNYEYVLINGHKIMNLTEKFVGTPEYISPEVLENKYNLIGPGVDIWAFGVILYLFFVGQTPFKGKNDDETLNNIKNVNYTFEMEKKHSKGIINIPKEAKDLIQKILVKDPTKRIGYGSKDYKEIKEHPFFKGINFDNLFEEPIPLSKIYSLLENYGYIDKIDESKDKDDDIYVNVLNKSENDILFDDNRSIGSVDNADLSTSCKRLSSNNLNLLRKTLNSSLNDLKEFKDNMIIDNSNNINNIKNETPKGKKNSIDKLLIEDILYKKSPWLHYNKRYVKLYSRGHLDCYDISTKILKGTIIINESTKAYALDDFRFQIVSQNKTYFFKHISKRVADNWVEKINCIVFDKIRNTKNRNY